MKHISIFLLTFILSASCHAVSLTCVSRNVTTAGTRVQLVTSTTKVTSFIVQAKVANTGKIYLGDVTVSSTIGQNMSAADRITIGNDNNLNLAASLIDLSTVYIDAQTNGEGVQLCYLK